MRWLITLAGMAAWGILVIFLAFEGAWMTRIVPAGDTQAFYDWAAGELSAKNKGSSALVMLQNAEVTKQYYSNHGQAINEDTLFPTASFSKWVTALGVVSLAEDGLVDLDSPVARYLTRWTLPESGFDNNQVTVRRLLSHTAGLTDGLGFGDYSLDENVPDIEEELRHPRASSGKDAAVAVGIEPGSEFLYSGGGYLLLQLLVEEVSGVTFEQYIQLQLFDPLGMERSAYSDIASLENVSHSYNIDGEITESFNYASAAATGLASSTRDLAKLAKALLLAKPKGPLAAATVEGMREPQAYVMGAGIWGLGTMLYAPSQSGDYVFGHDGANDPAINSTVRLNPDTSDGIILLVSGHPSLASHIGSEWVLWQTGKPDFLQTDRALKSAIVPFLVGSLLILCVGFWRS